MIKRLLLLGASYLFYAFFAWQFLWILLLCTVIAFIAGIILEKTRYQHIVLGFTITLFLCILGYFKYRNFFADTINAFGAHLPIVTLMLPIGISFYLFEAIGYLIDVKRKTVPASKNILEFALFLAFFPKVFLGPIERAGHLLPQIRMPERFSWDAVETGLLILAWGAFKKLVMADQLGVVLEHHTAPLFAAYIYAFQLYFDFSGYTDMAIGAARIFGLSLLPNFHRPYASLSIAEFWRRWHMSFSFWLRDYLYIPLGGNRVPVWRRYLNVFLVFLLSGLWHGAGWTFVLWGCMHGLFMTLSMLTAPLRSAFNRMTGLVRFPRVLTALRIFVTFHLVAFAWILFYSPSLSAAFDSYRRLPEGLHVSLIFCGFLAFTIACVEGVEWLRERVTLVRLRWPAFYTLILAVMLFGHFHSSFIYVRF